MAGVLVLLARWPSISLQVGRVLTGVGYLAALLMLWYNHDRPWIPLVLAGTSLNALVILANGGRMPITPAGLLGAGRPPAAGGGLASDVVDPRHLLAGPGTPLAPLGDSFPFHIGGFGAAVSPGDLLMAVGVAGFLGTAMFFGRRPEASL
jgi:hypothetical protein